MNFRQLRGEVSINLTPLIDVVFLLLIFFMVSTSFAEVTQLVVDLPEAEGALSTNTTLLLVSMWRERRWMERPYLTTHADCQTLRPFERQY